MNNKYVDPVHQSYQSVGKKGSQNDNAAKSNLQEPGSVSGFLRAVSKEETPQEENSKCILNVVIWNKLLMFYNYHLQILNAQSSCLLSPVDVQNPAY